MIETFYNQFGFLGALGISVGVFLLFLCWIAGVAGMAERPNDRYKNLKLVACVVIPIYPIIWLMVDMFRQHSSMKHH